MRAPASARAATATARIGVILPLSKPGDSVAGSNMLKSAQLWVDWVNSHGGVDGQHVELKVYDDKADPRRGVKNVVRGDHEDHCSVILAGWASSSRRPRSRRRTSSGCRCSWPTRGRPTITKANYPEVVRIGPNNDMLSNAFAPFMKKRDYRHVAIIAEDTAFGQGLGGAIRATGDARRHRHDRARSIKRDTHDLRPALKKLLAASRTRS